jgi:hypothetical protein
MTVEPMPPTKPTIAEIVMDCSKFTISKDYMADVLVPKARAHYPDMPPEQLEAAVRAEAIAWNKQLDGEEFFADLEAAAALDPDWHDDRHGIGPNPGALHDTPQKLVAEYRRWLDATLPPDDLVDALTARAFDALGIRRRTFNPDRPGDVERVRVAMMQLVEEHPRSAELLDYALEQGLRQMDAQRGKRGKAKRG